MTDKRDGFNVTIETTRGADQFPLRFPDGLRAEIKAAAKANGRSMNAELVSRLTASPQMDRIEAKLDTLLQALDAAALTSKPRSAEGIIHPCPLCGGKSLVVAAKGGADGLADVWRVECSVCDRGHRYWWSGRADAIDAWNGVVKGEQLREMGGKE